MGDFLREFALQVQAFIPRLGAAIAVYAGFYMGGWILQRVVLHLGNRSIHNREVLELLGRTTSGIAIILGAVTALGTMGVNISALVASLGLTGFALGFAFKDALSNLLSGLLLLIYRPFKRGDRIAVAGYEGKVLEINFRYTVLDGSGKKYLVPNSTLFTNAVSLIEQTPQPQPVS